MKTFQLVCQQQLGNISSIYVCKCSNSWKVSLNNDKSEKGGEGKEINITIEIQVHKEGIMPKSQSVTGGGGGTKNKQ